MDIRFPVGALFVSYGVLLILHSLVGGSVEARHMLAGLNVNLFTGIAMLIFGSAFVYLSRRGGPTVRRSAASAEGRATEADEKRRGLEE